jgi:hypothetical protein
MKNIYILSCCLLVTLGFSQVGISTTPDPSAELEVTSTTRGFLVPRLTLVARGGITNTTPNQGMMAYITDGTAPGMYYIQSSITNWTPMSGAVLGWPIVGRAGTTAANYVGTTAVPAGSADFVFKTNSVERMRFLATTGFLGIGTALPSTVLHLSGTSPVLRIEDGTQAANKIMVSDATGVMTWASPGSVFSPDWDTFGNSIVTGNFVGTLASVPVQDFIIKTNNTEKMRVQADGNIRIGPTFPVASQLHVQGATSGVGNATIRAINNNIVAGAATVGVIGDVKSTELGSNALKGQMFSIDPTIGEIGVLGKYQNSGAAIFGLAYNSNFTTNFITGNHYGAFGTVNYNDLFARSSGVYGKSTQKLPGLDYGMYCEGNFATNGAVSNGGDIQVPIVPIINYPTVKAASIPTTQGNQLVYCKESPEMWFEDFGFAQLQNGTAHIKLEDLFLETVFIDNAHKMHVVLQEQAESKGLYFVVDADHKGFTVKEKKGGNSNAAFSYSIMAKRRFYQDQRFGVDALQPFGNNLVNMKDAELNTTDPKVMKAYVDKAVADKNAKFAANPNGNTPGFAK